jgi:2-methylcitrate dehydratase
VRAKEEADHSLPYLLALALWDGQVLSEQNLPERIVGDDKQQLLRRVDVRPEPNHSRRVSDQRSPRLRIRLRAGARSRANNTTTSLPHPADAVEHRRARFNRRAAARIDSDARATRRRGETLDQLERLGVAELTRLQ